MFGITSLRPEQLAVAEAVLRGQDTVLSVARAHPQLFVSPTGSGKSLTYQLPTLLHDGVTLVVSPLISLMQDQSRQLPTLLPSVVLSGVVEPKKLVELVQRIAAHAVKVLFVSPEKLFSPFFQRLLTAAHLAQHVRLFVVDEAHCVSSWSFNFRVDYLRLYRVLTLIRAAVPCTLLCLTATGGRGVKEDICRQLHIAQEAVVDRGWRRAELQLCCLAASQPHTCQQSFSLPRLTRRLLVQFLKSSFFTGPASSATNPASNPTTNTGNNTNKNVVVFVPFRHDTQALCDLLQSYNIDVPSSRGSDL